MEKEAPQWPIYFKDRLIVSNLNSPITIVTLWTPKELIQKMTDAEAYCVMGQLYTKKGINYLLRNILAHPTITTMYVVGNDLMGSGQALIAFFKNGVDDEYRIIGDDGGVIEKEIPRSALAQLRDHIEAIDFSGNENLAKMKELFPLTSPTISPEYWAEPARYPDPPMPEISRFPAEIDSTKIRRPTIAEAYTAILKHISLFGLESEAMIGYVSETSKKMKEMVNITAVVTDEDPHHWHIPDYLPFNTADLEKYFDGFFDADRHSEDYTYGERLYNFAHDEMAALKEIYPWLAIPRFQDYFMHGGFDQISVSIVRKLSKFPYDKGAIALLANPFTDVFPQRPPKKTPCLFLVQCQIYQKKLQLTAYFRSNDMYNAWPLNAFALRKLQFDIASRLDVEMGALITISNMAHIYEHNWGDAEKITTEHFTPGCEWDPRGNFHIAVEGEEIVVQLATPRGNEIIKEWRMNGTDAKASNKLCFQIMEQDLAVSVIGNAADLARQIERAVTAVRLGIPFEQDNALDFSSFDSKTRSA